MVFSFFKKDPKDGKAGAGRSTSRSPKPVGKPMPEPAARGGLPTPAKFSTTENANSNRDLARSLAMETAAKIDAIESEMARDFLRPAANTGNPVSGPTTARGASGKSAVVPIAAAPAPDDGFDASSDVFMGSVDAIEIHTSGAGSVIDETAILFANGQAAEAEETLRQGIQTDSLGGSPQHGWLMLFELVNQRGDKAAFEQLTMQYALRFENSPPAWVDYSGSGDAGPVPLPPAGTAGPVVQLPAVIDANVVKPLEQLKALASQHAALSLDASATRSIDLVGAELLLRVVNAFKRSNHELTILGCEQLLNPLRQAVEPGRRDASDAAWMLLLEVLRLLGKQHDFEETGIQYCITFEVSPPSWEPPPPNLKIGAASARSAAPAPASAAPGPLDWRGVIDGEGEAVFSRLVMESRTSKHLIVECKLLQRMGFSAASALLTQAMRLQSSGVRLEFRNVNPLVGALLHLLGVTAVAAVQLRRV